MHPNGRCLGRDTSVLPAALGRHSKVPGSLLPTGTAPESHSLATGAPLDKHRWAAPWTSQYKTLLHRAVKTRRFEALSTRDFIQFVVVGVLAGGPPPVLLYEW